MQIVIDMSEHEYEVALRDGWIHTFYSEKIKNGKPLPKGHGRLIDADMVMFENCIEFDNLTLCGETGCDMDCKTCDLLELYPKDVFANVVIKADKEVDE